MKNINLSSLVILLALVVGLVGCVDNEFDQPDGAQGIDDSLIIPVSEAIAYLDQGDHTFTDSVFVKGVVTANDESGNFYKTLIFQDASGAMNIALDQNELNAAYPEGNTVYVLLQGLTIARNAGTPQLGLNVVDGRVQRVPDALVSQHVIAGGKSTDPVEPLEMTISEFEANNDKYLNKLVRLVNVEISDNEAGLTYATPEDETGQRADNRTVVDCDDNKIILRNSDFSNFAGEIMPQGNGTLVAIASKFNNDLQLFIRDTDDVMMDGERCDGSGQQAENEITIASIHEAFYDLSADKVPDGYITGIVISDKNTGQVNNRNVFFQNGDRGILIRFGAEHSFELGDELQITVSGQKLEEYKGLLQINGVPTINVVKKGNVALPNPKVITVAEILADNNVYESTRVLIKGATLDSDGTFAGSVKVDDGTGSINIFTYNNASFATDGVPDGNVDVTAIVSQFNDDAQLIINGSDDIEGGSVNPTESMLLTDFQDQTTDGDVNIPGWLNIAVEGSRKWVVKEYQGAKYAECEAYQDTNPNTLAWLITPEFNTADYNKINFDAQMAYWKHSGFSIWVSPTFEDVGDADWKELTDAKLPSESDDFFTDVNSGNVDVAAVVSGKVRVGFRYEGSSADGNTTKIRVDNVTLLKQ